MFTIPINFDGLIGPVAQTAFVGSGPGSKLAPSPFHWCSADGAAHDDPVGRRLFFTRGYRDEDVVMVAVSRAPLRARNDAVGPEVTVDHALRHGLCAWDNS